MAANKKQQVIAELRGSDRVFQIDRDTSVIYTGLHSEDMRPFMRVGAGKSVPGGVLRHIENVLLVENDPINIGLETAWLQATIDEGEESIRYVGSKDRVQQIYAFTGMRELEEGNRPVEAVPYKPVRLAHEKNRVTTTFFETGNAVVNVGTSKVYDHQAAMRGRIDIDKEYDLMARAMRRRHKKCEDGKGFIYFGPEYSPTPTRPCIYWNFDGRGLFLNPCIDPHYALFEQEVDHERVEMAVSYTPFSAGLGEFLRRMNHQKRNAGIYIAAAYEERVPVLKKIYNAAKLFTFGDGSALPLAKQISYFVSKTGSHGVFTYRMGPQADRMVQILFPLGGGKQNRSFDFLRPPHDLEFQVVHSKQDLEGAQGRLCLQMQGDLDDKRFQNARLSERATPLVRSSEYRFHEAEEPAALAETVMNIFAETPLADTVRDFLMLHLGLDLTEGNLSRALNDFIERPLPKENIRELYNLSRLFEYVRHLPVYRQAYTEHHRSLLEKLQKRYHPRSIRYSEWLALRTQDAQFHILFTPRTTLQFVGQAHHEPVELRMPPSYADLEANPKAYAKQLRTWEKGIDKAGDPPGFRNCIEFLERIYEERLRILEDRKRFQGFLNDIGIVNTREEEEDRSSAGNHWSKRRSWEPRPKSGGEGFRKAKAGRPSFLPGDNPGRVVAANRGGGGIMDRLADSGIGRTAALAVAGVVAVLLVVGVLWISTSSASSDFTNELSLRGDSAAERRAVELAGPGNFQEEQRVPGEDDIEAADEEVLTYANILARRNGFARLGTRTAASKRDPDRVFPGDELELPDGRRARVEPKEYIWEIARQHYRKDFARINILDRQISTNLLEYEESGSTESLTKAKELRDNLARLAVTPAMKRILELKDREIEKRSL